jgi:hypothetical protein
MPHHQYSDSYSWTGRSKRYPLPKPTGKIVHAVHDSSIYLFKVGFVTVLGFVGCPQGCGFVIV